MDIDEFATARYDEEQRVAEWAAKPHHGPQEPGDTAVWQVEEWVPSEHGPDAVPAAIWVTDRSEMGIGQMRPDRGIPAHIAYWDPARVLADIAAKRKLLALWQKIDTGTYSPDAKQLADDILEQLLAPYGKRAAWTRDAGWRIDG